MVLYLPIIDLRFWGWFHVAVRCFFILKLIRCSRSSPNSSVCWTELLGVVNLCFLSSSRCFCFWIQSVYFTFPWCASLIHTNDKVQPGENQLKGMMDNHHVCKQLIVLMFWEAKLDLSAWFDNYHYMIIPFSPILSSPIPLWVDFGQFQGSSVPPSQPACERKRFVWARWFPSSVWTDRPINRRFQAGSWPLCRGALLSKIWGVNTSGWWARATPLKNDGLRQLGWWQQPNINGKIKNGNQITNQTWFHMEVS